MNLLVGLGNPGEKYKDTRHNVGFILIDAVASKMISYERNLRSGDVAFIFEKRFQAEILKIGDSILAKPQTYMNSSGEAVKKLVDFYKIGLDDLYVIHDDLDIKLGEYKIQKGKGPKLHGGLNSIEKELGKEDFWRVRVGVENRANEIQNPNNKIQKENRISGEEYVLQIFDVNEREKLDAVTEEIVEKLKTLLS